MEGDNTQHGLDTTPCDKSCLNYSLHLKTENRVFHVLGRK